MFLYSAYPLFQLQSFLYLKLLFSVSLYSVTNNFLSEDICISFKYITGIYTTYQKE